MGYSDVEFEEALSHIRHGRPGALSTFKEMEDVEADEAIQYLRAGHPDSEDRFKEWMVRAGGYRSRAKKIVGGELEEWSEVFGGRGQTEEDGGGDEGEPQEAGREQTQEAAREPRLSGGQELQGHREQTEEQPSSENRRTEGGGQPQEPQEPQEQIQEKHKNKIMVESIQWIAEQLRQGRSLLDVNPEFRERIDRERAERGLSPHRSPGRREREGDADDGEGDDQDNEHEEQLEPDYQDEAHEESQKQQPSDRRQQLQEQPPEGPIDRRRVSAQEQLQVALTVGGDVQQKIQQQHPLEEEQQAQLQGKLQEWPQKKGRQGRTTLERVSQEDSIQKQPIQGEPMEEDPMHEDPIREERMEDEPMQEGTIKENPIGEEPLQEQLSQEQPMQDERMQEKPVQEEHVQEEPTAHGEPVEEERIQEQRIQEEPTQRNSIQDEIMQDEPMQDEPMQDEPTQENAIQSPPNLSRTAQQQPEERIALVQVIREPFPDPSYPPTDPSFNASQRSHQLAQGLFRQEPMDPTNTAGEMMDDIERSREAERMRREGEL